MLNFDCNFGVGVHLISKFVTVSGRKVPIHLDVTSWTGLERVAMQEGRSLGTVCAMVEDRLGDELTLSAGLRAFVTAYFALAGAQDDSHPQWAGGGLPVAMMARFLPM
ncbi:hypothetical protein WCLP8_560031 [uncultured Gammaproteobacteria bacterium]